MCVRFGLALLLGLVRCPHVADLWLDAVGCSGAFFLGGGIVVGPFVLGHRVLKYAAAILALEAQRPSVGERHLPVVLVIVTRLDRLDILGLLFGRWQLDVHGLAGKVLLAAAWRIETCVHVVALVVDFGALVAHAYHVLAAVLMTLTLLINRARLLRNFHSRLRVSLHRLLLQAELMSRYRLITHRHRLLNFPQLHLDFLWLSRARPIVIR